MWQSEVGGGLGHEDREGTGEVVHGLVGIGALGFYPREVGAPRGLWAEEA